MPPLLRILLVDSDRTATFLHERVLQRLAIAEQIVAVPNEAQAYLASFTGEAEAPYPTLILLALRMPIMDGWAFLKAYRQRQAPVVVLTVPGLSVADLERLQQLPIAGVSYRPLTPEKVKQFLPLLPLPYLTTA
jgi:CheY-like chemotaxis protein